LAVWGEGMSQFYAKAEDEERRAIASPVAACGLVERAHTRLVGDIDPNLTIRALPRKDGTWCVCATQPYGPSTYIGNFKSEVEAQNWIIHKAKEHFPKRNRPVLETC
jgi:hypothetical protein